MSLGNKLNRHITDKLEGSKIDNNVKEFVLEILRFEKSVADQNKPSYSDDYSRLIRKFVEDQNK